MLTPKDIETKKFSRAKAGGYHPEEVEHFLDDVLDSFNAVIAEKDHLLNKVEMLNEKLKKESDAKRDLEKAISDPQHIYNETLAAANAKADKIVFEAQNYAKKLIEAAHIEAERQQEVSNRFVTEVEEFKSKLLAIYESHVKLISSIPIMKIDEASTESATLEMLENSTVDASADDLPKEEPVPEDPVGTEEETKEETDDDFDFSGVIEEPSPAKDYVPSRYVAEETERKSEPVVEEKKESHRPARSMYVEKDEEPEIDGLFDTEEEKPKKAKKRGFNFFGFVKDSEPDDDDDFDEDFDDDDYFDDYDDEE